MNLAISSKTIDKGIFLFLRLLIIGYETESRQGIQINLPGLRLHPPLHLLTHATDAAVQNSLLLVLEKVTLKSGDVFEVAEAGGVVEAGILLESHPVYTCFAISVGIGHFFSYFLVWSGY